MATLPIEADPDQDGWRVWVGIRYAFDLAAWDAWLANLYECGAKAELRREREALYAALLAGDDDRAADKLKILRIRRAMIRAKPAAMTGDKVLRPFDEANDIRAAAALLRYAKWQGLAEKKWAQPLHAEKSASEIARLIAKPGENPGTIRRHIKKAGTAGGADK